MDCGRKLTYSVSELCDILGLGRNSAYSLVSQKDFPKIKVGKKILIPVKSLEKWLESKTFFKADS